MSDNNTPVNLDEMRDEIRILRVVVLMALETLRNNAISLKEVENCIDNYFRTRKAGQSLERRIRELTFNGSNSL